MSSPALSPTPMSPAPVQSPGPHSCAGRDPYGSLPTTPPPPVTPSPLPSPPEHSVDCPDPPVPTLLDPPPDHTIRTLLAKAHAQTLKFATRAAARHLPGAIGLATGAGQRNGAHHRQTTKAFLESGRENEWPDPPSPLPPLSPVSMELRPAELEQDDQEHSEQDQDQDQERKRALGLQLALFLAIAQLHFRSQCSPTTPTPTPSLTPSPTRSSNSPVPSPSTDEKLDQILSMMSDLAYAIASLQQQILVMDARNQHSSSHSPSSTTARGRSLSPHHLMLSSSAATSSFSTPPASRHMSISTTANGSGDPAHDALLAAKRAGKFLVPARRLSNSSAASTSDRRDSTSSVDSALHSPALPKAWPAKKGRDSACFPEPGTTGTDTDTDGQSTASSAPGIKQRSSRKRSTLASRLNMPTPLPEVAELSLSVASSAAASLIVPPKPKGHSRGEATSASTSASAVAQLIDRFQSMSPPTSSSPQSPTESTSSTPTPEKASRRTGGMVAQLIAAFSSSSSESSTSSGTALRSITPSPNKQTPVPATPTRTLPLSDPQPSTPLPPAPASQRGPPSIHSRASSACSTLLGPIVEEDDDEPSVASNSSSGVAGDDSFTRRSKIMSPTLIRMTQQLIDEEEMDVARQHVDVFEQVWSASEDEAEHEAIEEEDGWWYHGRGIESYFAPDYDGYEVDQDSMSVVSDPLGDITTMDDRETYVPLDETTLLLEEADGGDEEAAVGNGESSKESLVSPPLLPETPYPASPTTPTASRPTSTCSSDGKLDESNRESYPWHVHPLDRESSCCNVHNLLKSQRVPVSPFASKFAPPPSASRRASASVVEGPMSPPMSPLVARMSERARRAAPNGGSRNSICVAVPTTPRSMASPQPVSGTSRRDALEALRTPRRQPTATSTPPTRVSTPVGDLASRRQSAMAHSPNVSTPPHTPSPAQRRPRSSLVTPPAATLQQPMPIRASRSSGGGYVKSVAESLAAGMAIRTASPRSAATPPSMATTGGAASTFTSSGSSGSSRRSSITSYSSLRHLANVAVAPQPAAPRVVSQAPAPAPSSRAKPVVRAFRA
ncbi:hypothetical protein BCR44DRAFT_1440761 [Catenaria anguillulae PL171]|uniref:Uncharacterized protein n=1 Tax=Catenaria anguillulae PL171 TaxID=765915 RepID=A0A1Y2HCD7_9FUNG|nr:hypothetical protein BCR44DRAFT_1440761 [Catenaria anguillulae PL171]